MKIIVIILITVISNNSLLAKETIIHYKNAGREWNYVKLNIQGWEVFVEQTVSKDKKLIHDLKKQLSKDFKYIISAVPVKALSFLKNVKIWVSNEAYFPFRKGEEGTIPYHKSKKWLRDHGLNPAMAKGVHVINPAKVLYKHKIFDWGPMTILHELSHAYHNEILGFNNKNVWEAYQNSLQQKLYMKIPSRSNPKKEVKAYAATNREEYFAELSEAYFGRNDFFPKNRSELKEYDPVGFKMIQDAWEVEKKNDEL